MEGKPSLIGGLAALTARLDGLRVDQNPHDLSKALKSALIEPVLYKIYLSFLVVDYARAKALLEVFDKALTVSQHDIRMFKKFRQLCGRAGLLPDSHTIPNEFIQTTGDPVAHGGFGDVWEGISSGERVAIKALRIYKDDDVQRVRKVFCKEVAIWKRVSHPNIVPFLGVSEAPAPLSMVSEWMPNGNVRGYVAKNPDVSRLQLLLDIGHGLSYLHSNDIVHGDLKGDNILIDKAGCARLNDFGFTSIASLNCTETSSPGFRGSYRWMAPELLSLEQNPDNSGTPTPQSDIFAFGMVAIEVFTGQVPFPESERSYLVIRRTADGERPPRPQKSARFGLSDDLWAGIQSSWRHEAVDRPPLSALVGLLERAIPDVAMLEELTTFNENSSEHINKLHTIFGFGDNALLGMRENESLVLVEVFDRVLNSSLGDGKLRSRCLRGLQKVSARCGFLPKSYQIDHSSLAPLDGALSPTGRASDICQRLMDGQLVAVKMISPDCIENFNAFKKRLYSNAVMWKRLNHPNVANFFGFSSDSPPSFSLVYPWMSSRNLSMYLREHPEADKLRLLLDVAEGLTYLHQYNVAHGNLTGHNILVDGNGIACVSEYGLGHVLREEGSLRSFQANIRWMAPEVISTADKHTRVDVDAGKRADVYSFAMVMFEILTGTAPFPGASDKEIMASVVMGHRPEFPLNNPSRGLVDALWDQIEACWHDDPEQRPAAFMVLQFLQGLTQVRTQEVPQKSPQGLKQSQETPRALQELQGPQELLEHVDEDAWDYVEDTRELPSPNSKTHKEHFSLSGSTIVNSSIGRLFALPRHIVESDTKRDPSKGRRARAKQRVRHLLHLEKPELTTVEAVEEPKPEVEVVDQREETVQISNGSVSYLTSKPIPSGQKLKKVVITVDSKDQGWSSYSDDHGTYRNSWTWFELSVGQPSDKGSVERWRGKVVWNLHAHGEFKEHTIEILDNGLYEKAESGDVLTVWAHAQYQGWRNTVRKATIRYVVE